MKEKYNNIGLLMEYEDILLHKRKDFSSNYIRMNSKKNSVIDVFRYAFEELLEWSPVNIQTRTTTEIIEILHLKKIIDKLSFPPELDKKTDLFYLAHLLYPEKITYSKQKLTLRVYEKVLQGILSKFPKGFFSETEGILNACICLRYAINQKLYIENIEDLYLQFTDTNKMIRFFKDIKLYGAYCDKYEYPVDFLHEALSFQEKDDLLYQYARFLTDFNQAKEMLRKEDQKIQKFIKKELKKMHLEEMRSIFFNEENAFQFLKDINMNMDYLNEYNSSLDFLWNHLSDTDKKLIIEDNEYENTNK